MFSGTTPPRIVPARDVKRFFEGAIDSAMEHQGLTAQEATVDYVASILARFSRSERFLDRTEEGRRMPVLAFVYGEAMQAESSRERCTHMRRLGDIALFLSGVFADSFNRKLVDVDYCIQMGRGAYSFVAAQGPRIVPNPEERKVHEELAEKFSAFVDVLNEISERSAARSNRDLLRLYEGWVRTGSPRRAQQLRTLGIEVAASSTSRAWH